MTPPAVRRLGYAVGSAVAPAFTARRATNAFAVTRPLGTTPVDRPPLGATTIRLDASRDIRTGYVWDGGPGTALLVHGRGATRLGTDSSSMHSLVAPLRAAGLRVAAFDAPGHGVAPGATATIRQFTESVTAVVDTLADVRVVVAHSLGSIAAVAALACRTDLSLDGIVLLAPACTLTGALDRWSAGRIPRRVVGRVAEELGLRNGVPADHWDIRTLGRALDVPVLVVHDPADPLVPFAEARAAAEALPRARLAAVRGPGHAGVLTATPVKQLISTFLTDSGNREESRV
jgi:pimeloyl-ACP methyl ester carboxylesterase